MDWTTYLFQLDGRISRALVWLALADRRAAGGGCWRTISPVIGRLDGTSSAAKLERRVRLRLPRCRRPLSGRPRPCCWPRPIACADQGLGTPLSGYLAAIAHDRDRSGCDRAFFFLPNLLPSRTLRQFAPLDWACYALWLWGFVEMFVAPGTSGGNRFGPDPLAESPEQFHARNAPCERLGPAAGEIEIVPPSASPPGGMHVKRGA